MGIEERVPVHAESSSWNDEVSPFLRLKCSGVGMETSMHNTKR
jgi:hypothetical protein